MQHFCEMATDKAFLRPIVDDKIHSLPPEWLASENQG